MATENLTEEEMDRRIARYEALPTDHQRAGGAAVETAFLFTLTGLIGMWASLMLILSEREVLRNPDAILQCDINPLIGCSKWIGAWQNEVFFGVSNATFGLAFFAGVTALGFVLLDNGRFGRLLWRTLTVGAALGMLWVLWFAYQSYFVEGSLCPYCVITWLVTIPLFVHIVARTMQAGHWGQGAMRAGSALVRNRWIIVGGIFIALVAFTIVWFWDTWMIIF